MRGNTRRKVRIAEHIGRWVVDSLPLGRSLPPRVASCTSTPESLPASKPSRA